MTQLHFHSENPNLNLVDSSTYFFTSWGGASGAVATANTGIVHRGYLPDTILDDGIFVVYVAGTLATTETGTFGVAVNGTKIPIETNVVWSAQTNVFEFSNQNIEISAGDYVQFYFDTPAWVTNPTNSYYNVLIESPATEVPSEISIPNLDIAIGLGFFLVTFAFLVLFFKKPKWT